MRIICLQTPRPSGNPEGMTPLKIVMWAPSVTAIAVQPGQKPLSQINLQTVPSATSNSNGNLFEGNQASSLNNEAPAAPSAARLLAMTPEQRRRTTLAGTPATRSPTADMQPIGAAPAPAPTQPVLTFNLHGLRSDLVAGFTPGKRYLVTVEEYPDVDPPAA